VNVAYIHRIGKDILRENCGFRLGIRRTVRITYTGSAPDAVMRDDAGRSSGSRVLRNGLPMTVY
jgi:hypothetical protein